MDYTKRGVIQSGIATPTTAGVECIVGATANFAVFGIEATVIVAGAQAASKMKLFSAAGVALASITLGTSAAGTSVRAVVGDGSITTVTTDESLINADSYVYVASETNDASLSYSYRIIGNIGL